MPYKSEKIRLKPEQDRRRKISEEQKEEIRKIYARGDIGQRPLARMYGISRSMVAIIVNPVRAEYVKQYQKTHWKSWQRNKKERNIAQTKTRKYKQSLYLKGELKDD